MMQTKYQFCDHTIATRISTYASPHNNVIIRYPHLNIHIVYNIAQRPKIRIQFNIAYSENFYLYDSFIFHIR